MVRFFFYFVGTCHTQKERERVRCLSRDPNYYKYNNEKKTDIGGL